MDNPFLSIQRSIAFFSQNGRFFYLSILLFFIEFLFGALYLLWLSTFPNLKNKRVKFIYYIYQAFFFFDLWLCFSEAEYGSKYLLDISIAFIFAFLKFALLIALYGIVCAHRGVLILREKDRIKALEASLKEKEEKKDGQILKSQSMAISSLDKALKVNDEEKLADVNAAYALAVIDALKKKNLTDEERRELEELTLLVRFPIEGGEERSRKVNEKLEFLVKKMADYNVVI